jgi:serine protease Do
LLRGLAPLVFAAVAAFAAPDRARAQGTLSQLQMDVDQIARRARPSVVTVFAQILPRHARPSRPGAPGAPAGRIHTRVGSGVAVGESLILTTASVVIGVDRVIVRTANGIQVEAELAGMDPIFNLALLRVPEVRLPALRFAEDRTPQVGDWVIALGTSYRAQPTQSVGNIAYLYHEPRVPLLQLTNAVYPGNSGGAALNPRGELVGIVQGELGLPDFEARGPEYERRPSGMSLVLPVTAIRAAYESLRLEGRVRHGYLGVTTLAASVESESSVGSRVPLGALVEAVVANSPAARAELRRGDLIVGFEGDRVEYPEQLARWVAATRPGTAVDLVWVHNEIRRAGRVVLSESPAALPEWATNQGAPGRDPAGSSRISELEHQIRELNRRIGRLKGESSSVLR